MHEFSDNELISLYLKGDEEAFELLIQRYLKVIHNFVYRYVGETASADDLTQEVFVRAWRNLHPVRSPMRSRIGRRLGRLTSNGVKNAVLSLSSPSKGFDPNKGNFKTWLFAIAKNASLDFLKKKKAIPFSQFDDAEGNNAITDTLVDPAFLPNELLERQDLAHKLASLMEKLSPQYRMTLFLRYNDHFTFNEIAESLGEPINTVKSRHRRALIMLKKLLGS